MNAHRTVFFAALLVTGFATAAAAQGTMSMAAPKSDKKDAPKDSMAMSGMMMAKPKPNAMKHDGMKNDAMKHDAMKPDTTTAPSH